MERWHPVAVGDSTVAILGKHDANPHAFRTRPAVNIVETAGLGTTTDTAPTSHGKRTRPARNTLLPDIARITGPSPAAAARPAREPHAPSIGLSDARRDGPSLWPPERAATKPHGGSTRPAGIPLTWTTGTRPSYPQGTRTTKARGQHGARMLLTTPRDQAHPRLPTWDQHPNRMYLACPNQHRAFPHLPTIPTPATPSRLLRGRLQNCSSWRPALGGGRIVVRPHDVCKPCRCHVP
jgi:hypothetical protein